VSIWVSQEVPVFVACLFVHHEEFGRVNLPVGLGGDQNIFGAESLN
jgi:hypothetical protein